MRGWDRTRVSVLAALTVPIVVLLACLSTLPASNPGPLSCNGSLGSTGLRCEVVSLPVMLGPCTNGSGSRVEFQGVVFAMHTFDWCPHPASGIVGNVTTASGGPYDFQLFGDPAAPPGWINWTSPSDSIVFDWPSAFGYNVTIGVLSQSAP